MSKGLQGDDHLELGRIYLYFIEVLLCVGNQRKLLSKSLEKGGNPSPHMTYLAAGSRIAVAIGPGNLLNL